jgi:hypothetical protein
MKTVFIKQNSSETCSYIRDIQGFRKRISFMRNLRNLIIFLFFIFSLSYICILLAEFYFCVNLQNKIMVALTAYISYICSAKIHI